jgi:triacylglycerol esterase/lipase EstA (alpha/beta hydrolase family)
MRSRRYVLAALTLAIGVAGATLVSADRAGATPHYHVGDAASGYAQLLADPAVLPAGMNDWACRPTAAHPRPVILLPGTLWALSDSFAALSPILANAGYCVYGLNYGASPLTALSGGRIYAAGDIATSAHQLASFVSRVRQATGAGQVDIVGWSQGGMMPRYYLRYLGGAAVVHRLVGLAPSNHGTTLDGLFALVGAAGSLLGTPPLTLVGCPACTQQQNTAPFIQALNAGGDTVPSVAYTVIESEYDEVVTPYQSAFLSGPKVENITLQLQCPADTSEHLAMPYDSAALQDILNALGPANPSFRPQCDVALPLIGTP